MSKRFFHSFVIIPYVFTSTLFSCAFEDAGKIDLIKGVLHEGMYRIEDNKGLVIENNDIGKILETLLSKPLGNELFQKLKELSTEHSCIIKLEGPMGFIAGLQKIVKKDNGKSIWTINCSHVPMTRFIAVKREENVFEFFKVEVPPYIILAHELMHYLLRLENYSAGINGGKYSDKTFLNSLIGKITSENIISLFGSAKNAKGQAYDEFSVIVGHDYTINGKSVFLGETLFLQEYLGTSNCFLCYGHSNKLNDELRKSEIAEKIVNLSLVQGKIATTIATQEDLEKIENVGKGKSVIAKKVEE